MKLLVKHRGTEVLIEENDVAESVNIKYDYEVVKSLIEKVCEQIKRLKTEE